MFEKLEQLRKLPDHKKSAIALGGASCITAVIFVFWIVSLSVTLNSPAQDADAAQVASASAGVSPFSALEANVSAALSPIGSAIAGISAYFSGGTSTAATPPRAFEQSSPQQPQPASSSAQVYSTAVSSTNDISSANPAVPAAPLIIDHLLIPGDTGPQVVLLQKALAGQGFYNGPQNGKLGPATDAALIHFQTAYNIVPANSPGSGQAGPKTRSAINQLLQQ